MTRLRRWLPWLAMLGIVSVLVPLGVGAGYFPASATGVAAQERPATVADEKPKSVAVVLGYVDAPDGMTYPAPAVPGEVVEVLVKEGDTVADGAPLLRLDDRMARSKVRQARGGIQEAEAKLAQARQALAQYPKLLLQQEQLIVAEKAKLKGAQTLFNQATNAQARSFATTDQVDAAKAMVAGQEAAVSAAETKLEQIKGSEPKTLLDEATGNLEYRRGLLDEAQAYLDSHTLKARGPGKILRVFARPGTVFSPQSKQPAFWFQPAGALIIRAEVEQETAHRLNLGLSAIVQDDVHPDGATWKAKIVRIADSYLPKRPTSAAGIDPFVLNEARVLECVLEIVVEANQPMLRLGQKVRVNLGTE